MVAILALALSAPLVLGVRESFACRADAAYCGADNPDADAGSPGHPPKPPPRARNRVSFSPNPAVAGRPVTLTATPGYYEPDDDRPVRQNATIDWDLTGRHAFDDAHGTSVTYTFPAVGQVTVAARFTSEFGGVDVVTVRVPVAAASEGVPDSSSPPPPSCPAAGANHLALPNGLVIDSASCLEPTADPNVVRTRGPIRVNGIDLVIDAPAASARARAADDAGFSIDKLKQTIESNDTVRWVIGNATLVKNKVHLSGDGAEVKTSDFSFFAGFPVQGSLKVKFAGGGADVSALLQLPKILGGVTGALSLHVDQQTGLRLNSIDLKVPQLKLGDLSLFDMEIAYDAAADRWTGAGGLTIPGTTAAVHVAVTFTRGTMTGLNANVNGLNITIAPAVFLQRISFSFSQGPPMLLNGGVGITGGPQVFNGAAVGIDGSLSYTFGDEHGQPGILRASGTLKVANVPLSSSWLEYRTNHQITLGGSLDWKFKNASVRGSVSGWLDGNRAFLIEGKVTAGFHVDVVGDISIDADALVSNIGVAACGKIHTTFHDFGAGFGYYWKGGLKLFTGCNLSPWRPQGAPVAAAAAAVTKRTIVVPADTDQLDLQAPVAETTAGSLPRIALTDPDGHRTESPASGSGEAGEAYFLPDAAAHVTYALILKPRPGRWTIESLPSAQAGQPGGLAPAAPPLRTLLTSRLLPEPQVDTRVATANGTRKATYTVKGLAAGQSIRYLDTGEQATRVLGDRTARQGVLPLHPLPVPAHDDRWIHPVLVQNGLPQPSSTIDNVTKSNEDYSAPAPARLPAPTRLAVHRGARSLTISWHAVSGASAYEATVSLSDGRVLFFDTRKPSVTATATTSQVKVTDLTVAARDSSRLLGAEAHQ